MVNSLLSFCVMGRILGSSSSTVEAHCLMVWITGPWVHCVRDGEGWQNFCLLQCRTLEALSPVCNQVGLNISQCVNGKLRSSANVYFGFVFNWWSCNQLMVKKSRLLPQRKSGCLLRAFMLGSWEAANWAIKICCIIWMISIFCMYWLSCTCKRGDWFIFQEL